MKIVKSSAEMKNLSLTYQTSGRTVSLVPTMGALHKGHLSLLKLARENSDISVMSIFVNPTQFGPNEDFQKYPRVFQQDCDLAEDAGCDIIFAPSVEDMYPPHYSTYVSVEKITECLCGISRPNLFRGAATVVLKLLNIVNPQIAVFGQKDAQQLLVIRRMVRDLNLSVKIESAPIFREESGLALSSRNSYLTIAEKKDAPLIYKSLKKAELLYNQGERGAAIINQAIAEELGQSSLLKPEYINVVDPVELKPVDILQSTVLIAIACWTLESGTRLIDNIVLGGSL